MPAPTPSKPSTELKASGAPRSFVLVIAAAIGMTALGAAVALAVAIRSRERAHEKVPVPVITSARPAASAPAVEEIDLSP